MKRVLSILVIAALMLSAVSFESLTLADKKAAPPTFKASMKIKVVAPSSASSQAPDPMSKTWRTDPICQLVFFAVLEGLYTDGVPDEAVNLIVPPKTDLDTNVKHSFVFRCPLCHAAYEAFVLYQRRQAFNGSKGKTSTFGSKFDRKLLKGLRSSSISTRVRTMGAMIEPWIDRRIKMMNLTMSGKVQLMQKFLAYAKDGNAKFSKLRRDRNSIYFQWQFYGGCQACQAAINIAGEMEREKRAGKSSK